MQHISILNPHFVYAQPTGGSTATRITLGRHVLTREFSPEKVRSLLAMHPALKFSRRRRGRKLRTPPTRLPVSSLRLAGTISQKMNWTIYGSACRPRKRKIAAAFESLKETARSVIVRRHQTGPRRWPPCLVEKQFARLPEKDADEHLLEQCGHSRRSMKPRQTASRKPAGSAGLPRWSGQGRRRFLTEAAEVLRGEVMLHHFLKSRDSDLAGSTRF